MPFSISIQKLPALALCVALLALSGCGSDGPPRYSLSGKVVYNGQPVPSGLVVFEPDNSKGNKGPQGFSEIKDGVYRTDKFGRGAVSGPLIVRISGYTKASGGEGTATVLFPDYLTQIDLPEEATTFDFEVPAAARKAN